MFSPCSLFRATRARPTEEALVGHLGSPVICNVIPLLVVPLDCVVLTPVGDGEVGVLVLQALGAVHELLVVGQLPPVETVPILPVSSSSRVKAMSQLVAEGRGNEASVEQGRRKTQRESEVEEAVDEPGLDDHVVVGGRVEGVVLVLLPVVEDLLLLVERVDLRSPMIVANRQDVLYVILPSHFTFQLFILLGPWGCLSDGYLHPP